MRSLGHTDAPLPQSSGCPSIAELRRRAAISSRHSDGVGWPVEGGVELRQRPRMADGDRFAFRAGFLYGLSEHVASAVYASLTRTILRFKRSPT